MTITCYNGGHPIEDDQLIAAQVGPAAITPFTVCVSCAQIPSVRANVIGMRRLPDFNLYATSAWSRYFTPESIVAGEAAPVIAPGTVAND